MEKGIQAVPEILRDRQGADGSRKTPDLPLRILSGCFSPDEDKEKEEKQKKENTRRYEDLQKLTVILKKRKARCINCILVYNPREILLIHRCKMLSNNAIIQSSVLLPRGRRRIVSR